MSLTPVLTDADALRTRIRKKAIEGIQESFPLKVRDNTISLEDVKVHEKDFGPNDQKRALLEGTSLHEPVKGTVVLKDKEGKEVERVKNFTLLNLPYFTERHSFIVDGNEYQVSNQIRMKPGVYTRRRQNGELEAAFNTNRGGVNFKMVLDAEKGHPYFEYKTTVIPLYPVLRAMGVSHDAIAKEWGHDIAGSNADAFNKKIEPAVDKLYKKVIHPAHQVAKTHDEKVQALKTIYETAGMDPEVNEATLGHPHDKVTPAALLDASKKVLRAYKSGEDVDDRDSLAYKTFHRVDDFIRERLKLDARMLALKVKGRATSKTALRDIMPSQPFTSGVRSFLTGSKLSSIPTQINPIEIIDHAVKVTSLGEGGIASERAIPLEARLLHATHLGILDPIRTPESFNAGVDIRTALATMSDEKGNLYTPLRNVRTGKFDYLAAKDISKKVVAFPGQKLEGKVGAMKDGKVQHVSAQEVDYELYHPAQMYSPTTNLIPLMESIQGNRATMGSKMQTQALPLVHREAPLVQVGARRLLADKEGKHEQTTTFEKWVAQLTIPTARQAGRVVKVDSQYIYIDPHATKHSEFVPPLEVSEKVSGKVKRQTTVNGLTLKLELDPGDFREGINKETGEKWKKEMHASYGYVPKTEGDDGETVDIYLKEDGFLAQVFIVHQNKKDGTHDEDKCMLGFSSAEEAKAMYLKHVPAWCFGSMDTLTWSEFIEYLYERRKTAADTGLIRIPYETNFPYAAKTYLHQDVIVKPGDWVHEDQPLAESNFTKDGVLALGKNMSVAYVPYHGLNSNDAVVISEGAAQKLTSEHMYKELLEVDPDITPGRELHRQYFGAEYTRDQYSKLGESGVVKKGQKVLPHDPLIVAVRKGKPTSTDILLGNIKKTLAKPYHEIVVAWDHDFEGEVVDVFESPKRIVVTVKTQEPMRVGDKLCFDEETEALTDRGWVPVDQVSLVDRVATLIDGKLVYQEPTALHTYPQGGDMYHIVSQQVDQFVTLAHHMYVKTRGSNVFELLPAQQVLGKRVRYKKDAAWEGHDPKDVVFPSIEVKAGQRGVSKRMLPAIHMPVDTYVCLLGAYLSEGNIVNQPKTGDYGIDICQIKEPNRALLLQTLCDLGIAFSEGSAGAKVRIYGKQLMLHFQQFGHSHQKFIPPAVFSYSRASLQRLFFWLMWGDGHTDSVSGLPIFYTTTSPRLADDVQRLCLHIGKAANIQSTHTPRQQIKGVWYDCRRRYDVRIVTKKLEPQVNHGHVKTQHAQREAVVADYDRPVYCITVPGHVLYVRRNGKTVWSGNSGRYGNKGVVSHIVPDHQMIQDENKKPVDILYTSAGIISRINPAQIIETAISKVAEKLGKPIVVENFTGRDNVQWAKDLLKQHGVKDKETVYDPVSGKSIPNVLVGKQFTLRLFKTTDTNFAARGTGGYDVNLQPSRGGDSGSKALGQMEFNALVAHNARNVLKEAAAIKSQKNDEFWRAVQLGLPLPATKAPFVWDKFMGMLTAAGIKPDKRGSHITLMPLTDSDIKKMSSGTIENEKLVRAKDLAPERGGFFDPAITGGAEGTRWSHIELAEPIVNPVFMDPARRLLGLTTAAFEKEHSDKGGAAIKKKLNAIDVDAKLKDLRDAVKNTTGTKLDDLIKQIKYLMALKAQNLRVGDAYVISKLPVIPPVMRPVLPGKGGQELVVGDANYLYPNAFLHNKLLKQQNDNPVLPPEEHAQLRQNLFHAVGAVIGTHESDNPKLQKRNIKGFLEHLTGKTTPKSSFFQQKIMKRNQDVSGRGTIAPDGSLHMDDIGIPEDMLWEMFGKFVIARLVRRGFGAVAAKEMLETRHPAARDALLAETRERPVMVNRAPSLHRYNLVAAYAVPTPGKTIMVNPFIEKGMSADYDGDTFMVHAPATVAAVEDAKRMTLSHLVFGDRARDQLMVEPAMEAVLGVHIATQQHKGGSEKVHHFKGKEEALAAYKRGEVGIHDYVEVG